MKYSMMEARAKPDRVCQCHRDKSKAKCGVSSRQRFRSPVWLPVLEGRGAILCRRVGFGRRDGTRGLKRFWRMEVQEDQSREGLGFNFSLRANRLSHVITVHRHSPTQESPSG
ncbi:unnamed protein product [Ascophyllum nodosum]